MSHGHVEHAAHGHADHSEHAHANPAMKWFGIAGAIATAVCMTMILENIFHFPRTASGVLLGVVGIPMGAFSNSNSANPNGQAYMEWFGITLFACSLFRFLHVYEILGRIFAENALMTSVLGIAKWFM